MWWVVLGSSVVSALLGFFMGRRKPEQSEVAKALLSEASYRREVDQRRRDIIGEGWVTTEDLPNPSKDPLTMDDVAELEAIFEDIK